MLKNIITIITTSLLLHGFSFQAFAQKDKEQLIKYVDANVTKFDNMQKEIWGYAEPGFQEVKSSGALQEELKKAGFDVQAGVAGMPTAFVASYGSGKPVIGILAEFDALPGLSQEVATKKKPIEGQRYGHACGHHLFGVGSVAAAEAVKEWLKQSGKKGTIRVYGTPAEEGGAGKVYMVREGLFKDVDVVLHWHPWDQNEIMSKAMLANKSAKFRFTGIAAHASASPEKGRSALDAVEAMDYMVNMMREHVPQETRIHYVITKGGDAPNIVPAYAEVFYYARSPKNDELKNIWDRIVKAAEGAALGTETEMNYEVIHGAYSLLPNETLSKVMQKNLETVGGVNYSKEEVLFAKEIQSSLSKTTLPIEDAQKVQPLVISMEGSGGSTDVGDVSWNVPVVGLSAATWVPGTPAHSWQAVAAGGMSIGTKGMIVAAKTLAITIYDLFNNPQIIAQATQEFEKQKGPDFKYEALLGDRLPPLNYRN